MNDREVDYTHSIPPDFNEKMTGLKTRLDSYTKAQELLRQNRIGFGPTYHARSSGQVDTTVRTIFLIGNEGKIERGEFIAFDKEGNIIGFETSSLFYNWDKKQYTNEGYIYTAVRGKGISTVLSSAYADFLQRLATQYKKPIEWVIFNANAYALKELEKKNNEDPTLDNLVAVLEKRIEQDRWQAQYEPGRRFATAVKPETAEDANVIFLPLILRRTDKPMIEDVETIENIFLAQGKIGKKMVPVEIKRVIENEKPFLHTQNLMQFNTLMSKVGIRVGNAPQNND